MYFLENKILSYTPWLKFNHKNYNFLACDWFKKVLFSTHSLAKLLSDSLLPDSLLLVSPNNWTNGNPAF